MPDLKGKLDLKEMPKFAIPTFLKYDNTLSNAEARLLIALTEYADNEGWYCYPSRQTLANDCNTSKSYIDKIKVSLKEKNIISYNQRGYGTNMYQINKKMILSIIEEGKIKKNKDNQEVNEKGQPKPDKREEVSDKVITLEGKRKRKESNPKQNEDDLKENKSKENKSTVYNQFLDDEEHERFEILAKEFLKLISKDINMINKKSLNQLNKDLWQFGENDVFAGLLQATQQQREQQGYITITSYNYIHKVLIGMLKEEGKLNNGRNNANEGYDGGEEGSGSDDPPIELFLDENGDFSHEKYDEWQDEQFRKKGLL